MALAAGFGRRLDFTKEKTSINSDYQKDIVTGRAHRHSHKSATTRKLTPPLALPLSAKSRGEGKNGAARSSPRSSRGEVGWAYGPARPTLGGGPPPERQLEIFADSRQSEHARGGGIWRRLTKSPTSASHAAPAPSSGCAAPALRFGRFAVTAPGRRGKGLSSRVAERKRPSVPVTPY